MKLEMQKFYKKKTLKPSDLTSEVPKIKKSDAKYPLAHPDETVMIIIQNSYLVAD